MAHEEKQKVVGDYFENHIGSMVPRNTTFNWQALEYSAESSSLVLVN